MIPKEPKVRYTVTQLECKRCGHEWFPRSSAVPRKCPGCCNPNWHIPAGVLPRGRPYGPKEEPLP